MTHGSNRLRVWKMKIFIKICKYFCKNPKVFEKNADIYHVQTTEKSVQYTW